jgi:hypothetical protein
MEFRPVDRDAGAFQQSVTAEQVQQISRRVFGASVVSAVELGAGLYNQCQEDKRYRWSREGFGMTVMAYSTLVDAGCRAWRLAG